MEVGKKKRKPKKQMPSVKLNNITIHNIQLDTKILMCYIQLYNSAYLNM